MSVLIVPTPDPSWPTLGPDVGAWMESHLTYGPGDLRGQPYRVDDEDAATLDYLYALYPRGEPQAGRRRFSRAAIVRRKGTAKSEFAAAVSAAEGAPDAPVRCADWVWRGRRWIPVGRAVADPYIPMIAYTEEQSDELAYSALLVMLSEGPFAADYDFGLERIVRRDGTGKWVSLASAPSARDGARTTFQLFDETHRMTSARHRQAHQTMLSNLAKRVASDPWQLEITTRHEPGVGSVAEGTEDYARAVAAGRVRDPRLFFYLREASDLHDLATTEGRTGAVIEATAECKRSWTNFPAILGLAEAPDVDLAYWTRVWTNRLVKGAARAFDAVAWANAARATDHRVPAGALITLGFDGSRYHDATALVGCEVASGYVWLAGIWERPESLPPEAAWEVPAGEVETAVARAFARWDVARMYADPPYWEGPIASWAGRYGDKVVVEWWTNRTRQMAYALRGFATAVRAGDLSHDGDPYLAAHVGNAVRVDWRTDDVGPLWTIAKERPGSPHKIDAAAAACLAWEARTDAITAGALNVPDEVSAYETVRSVLT